MQTTDMILADDFCRYHSAEISFIYSLSDAGLIEVIVSEQKLFLPAAQLFQLEKLVRLHYDLDISIEGLETISHLLGKIDVMQQHIVQLSNRLNRYEDL